ncbi:Rcf3 protein [Pichia kluyveri]|uniref:Rcf3 protein n=1 Tax=Pichia kluyveri TaxID=36015 RepID=A0AAV5R0T3_PICKL|nr:Rcf3 protein [Pichia kluyveri]
MTEENTKITNSNEHFDGSFSNPNLHHTSKEHLNRLQQVIIKSTLIGGLYGAMISIPSELFIRWRSPLYRAFGFRIRVFYHTIWISAAAAFRAEREVIAFENLIRKEEEEKRAKLLELSILNGVYSPEYEGYKNKK